jgi:hypothetical protein
MTAMTVVAMVVSVGATDVADTFFLDTLGFEDDVDVVVSPNREFMVVAEEAEDGSTARLRIIDLDPATGAYVAILFQDDLVPGYENGVDPIIILREDGACLILVPLESEDGSDAKLTVLRTTVLGGFLDRVDIELGNLGFREDVDGIWNGYTGGIAFFPLESEDRSVRGVLAIDADDIDGDWGSCRLLSTDGRTACAENDTVPWLPGLWEGMDPVAYEMGDRLRLALPVSTTTGSDLLLLDFDSDVLPGDVPPEYMSPHISVKDANAAGPKPLAFPGYECDVDIVLLEPGQCEVGRSILIPVELDGTGDVADLYKVDQWGTAQWVYSMDGGDPNVTIKGYEKGVDLLTMCGLPVLDPPNRLAVPIENSAGTDADLLILDITNLLLLAHLEDPALNPALTIPGYEVGVDLVRWTTIVSVAAVEAAGSDPGLLAFRPDGSLADAVFDPDLLGFVRSVDPIVAPVTPFPALIVPIGEDDGSDSDVIVFTNPPGLVVGYSLELVNPPLELSRCQWDVDLGLIDKSEPGELYLCVPEEPIGGGPGRLRFELTAGLPGDRVLALATTGVGALPASLYLVDVPTGNIIVERNDLLGLETGLDMANGNGPVTPGDMPDFLLPTGVDRDGDPTIAWRDSPTGVTTDAPKPADNFLDNSFPNPFNPTTTVRYGIEDRSHVSLGVYSVAGQLVRTLVDDVQSPRPEGFTVEWDGLNNAGRPVASGVYFIRLVAGNFTQTRKAVLLK